MGRGGRPASAILALASILGLLSARPAAAQLPRPISVGGVEALPPTAIEGLADARPYAPMEFSRAWLAKTEQVRRRRQELLAEGRLDGLAPREAAALGAALSGTLRVLVVPILYADQTAPFAYEALSDRLFGPSRGDTVSYATYFDQVSAGLLRVTGNVTSWIRMGREAGYYLPKADYGWASFGRIRELREEALQAIDAGIDFGQFDNDGPDGEPNSGDDDGYVDFVIFAYNVPCRGDARDGAIWPHRGAMRPYATRSLSRSGEPIRVTDYLILPVVDAETCAPLHVGVLAHETGHVLGLPDLYDYDGSSQGIGAWGLMGTGSHNARYSPAHLGAWEKEQLGWVRVRWLRRDTAGLALEPVETGRAVFRYDLPGKPGEYLLFENRQRIGSDARLPGTGLLVWRIDPERGELGAWNADERRPAVAVLEADGNDLARGRGASAGDPFPGTQARRIFEMLDPATLRLSAIREADRVVSVDVAVTDAPAAAARAAQAAQAAPTVVRLATASGAAPVARLVRLRTDSAGGAPVMPSLVQRTGSWLRAHLTGDGDAVEISADPASLPPGAYADTVSVHSEDEDGVTERQVVVALEVAAPGGAEVVAAQLPWSWGLAARDGRLLQAGYGWDPLALRPRPRLLHLAPGTPFPRTLARLPADALFAPVAAPDSGTLVLAHAAGANYLYHVGDDGSARLVSGELGRTPAYGAAALADGSVLVADWGGEIRRVEASGRTRLWKRLDQRLYQIAADAAGNVAAATLEGDVVRVSAEGKERLIPTGFGRGRLVAVAITPAGDIFAAERGGQGRILRLSPDGRRIWAASIPGAQFYGLTVSGEFLYALDLGHRQVVRLPLSAPPGGIPADVTGK